MRWGVLMFNYAQKDLSNKIKLLSEEITIKEQEYQGYENDEKRLLSCIDIRKEITSYKKALMISDLLGATSFACITIPIVGEMFAVASFLCFGIAVFAAHHMTECKKTIKDQYFNISVFFDEELLQEVESLKQQKNKVFSELNSLYRERNKNSIALDKVIRYQNIVEGVLDEVVNDPYYQADNEEQYEILSTSLEEREKCINDFLLESRKYSTLETYNDIDKPLRITKSYKKQ